MQFIHSLAPAYAEIFLLCALCAILLIDLFLTDEQRGLTYVLSLLSLLEDGATVEFAAVGNEGLVGIPVVTGGDTMPSRVEVRSPGFAYRIPARVLRGGHRIHELPVKFDPRSRAQGKKIGWRDGVRAIQVLLAERIRR